MTAADAMAQVTGEFAKDGVTPYKINDGNCEDWAYDVKKRIGSDHAVEVWETVFDYADTSHVFLCIDGKFYDAECPEGVDDAMELPIFKKIGKPQPLWRVDHNGRHVYPKSRINFTKSEVIKYNEENEIDWENPDDIEDD